MIYSKLLPWDYGVRNLFRRPTRTCLTLAALTVVVLMVFVVVSFLRGLEQSLASSGDPEVVLVYSVNAEANVENSSVAAPVPGLLVASLPGVRRRSGTPCASPELSLPARVAVAEGHEALGIIRGVTGATPLVRRRMQLSEGAWPQAGEVAVGRLAAAKLGTNASDLAVGKEIGFEGRRWKISGTFQAGGAAIESEVWCRLEDLQQATLRQDLSLVALLMKPGDVGSEVKLLCRQRTDLELQAVNESDYYAVIQKHYGPVRTLAWLVVALVSGAGVFSGLNMMYGAIAGRSRELATLQAIGYSRRAILVSLLQEGTLLAAAASLAAATISLVLLDNVAVRFTMGAFSLRVDGVALIIGCAVGLVVGAVGSLPPALKALRMSVVEGLKAV